jgi:PAS domain S-box-containing protein
MVCEFSSSGAAAGAPGWVLRRIALAFLTLAGSLAASPCQAEASRKQVLILGSYHRGYMWSDAVVSEVEDVLRKSGVPVELHFEQMDSKRHATDDIFPLVERLYRDKYAQYHFDVIIACDDNALEFMLARRELFQGAPVVFCGVNNYRDSLIEGQADIAGVAEDFDFAGTMQLALRLHPGTRRVALVTDSAPTGRAIVANAREVYSQFPEIVFDELSALTGDGLRTRLAALPRDTVVFTVHFLRDASGRAYSVSEGVELIESSTDRPIYTCWEQLIGPKTVGGIITDPRLQGAHAARMALRVLAGERPEDIGVMRHCPTRPIFNYAAMDRFGIRPSDLPEGTEIINRPVSYYQEHKRVIWVASGIVGGLIAVVVVLSANIVLRRRAEMRLRAAEREKALILTTVSDLVTYEDTREQLIWANPAALRAMGLPDAASARGRSCHLVMDAEGKPRSDSPISEALRSGQAVEREVTLEDGRAFSISAHPVRGEEGRIIGCVQVARDITGRRRAQRERRRLEAQVQHAQKLESLGVLAGGIAHDFNNLLVGILGNADLALMDLVGRTEVRESIEEVKKAARRASELTNQLLAYSGKGKFVVEPVNLNETVVEMADLLKVSRSPNTTMHLEFDDALPAVRADASQMRQVVMNLITNACDAIGSEEGEIAVRTGVKHCSEEYLEHTYLAEERPAGDYVFLEVSDTGCGMDETTRARLFDPFYTTKFAGRGLGLAAVLGIVRGHEGAIEVESTPARGTCFRVLLPRCDEEPPGAKSQAHLGPEREQYGGIALVVDDEDSVRTVATMMFERLGFEVLQASDGREGVEIFRARSQEIDLVLLDMTMPGLDGKAAFEQMRGIRPDAKVLLSSGFSEQDATSRFAGEGLAGFIQKPFDLDGLSKAVDAARGI